MNWYYAVAIGKNRGIYLSWNECESQIKGYKNAKYKKFKTTEEAATFIRINTSLQKPDEYVKNDSIVMKRKLTNEENQYEIKKKCLKMDNIKVYSIDQETIINNVKENPKDPLSLVAFCDGSSLGNGTMNAKSGYACIFPHDETWNISKKINEKGGTNNRAEYLAAYEAIKRANIEDKTYNKILFIFTDSMLLIQSMTLWINKWKNNNWLKADGKSEVKNKDLLKKLLNEINGRKIIWTHVKAHTGNNDWFSIWNDKADKLAKEAAAN